MLAHKGEREGIVLAELLAGKSTHGMDYANIPSCTYCHPEVASIGLTEQACKEKKLDYKVGKFPFSANGRARTAGETEGFVKIIRDAKYGEILGAHIDRGSAGPRRFLCARKREDPDLSATRALRALRDAGFACEQGRFARLFTSDAEGAA